MTGMKPPLTEPPADRHAAGAMARLQSVVTEALASGTSDRQMAELLETARAEARKLQEAG